MRWLFAWLAAVLLMQGCALPAPPAEVPAENASAHVPVGDLPPDNVLVTDAASLAGTWYNWPAEGEPHRGDIILTIEGNRIVFTSGCATMAWTYRIAESRLQVTKAPVASCARGLSAREEQFAAALGAANVAYHRGGRGLIFEGPRGRLLLSDRPSEPPVATLAGEWRVAAIDGRALTENEAVTVNASDREIWWSPRCAGYARSYRIDGTSFSIGPYIGWSRPRPGEPPPPVCLIAPPARTGDVFDVLGVATTIRRTAEGGVEISGPNRRLLLFSQ